MGKGDRKTRKGKRFINSPRKKIGSGYAKFQRNSMVDKEEKEKNAYEEYLIKLDSSGYGHGDSHKINGEFQEVIGKLVDAEQIDIAMMADLDRQVFATRKSFDYEDDEENGTAKGLSWQISGVQPMEDGTEIPIYWPNVRNFTQENYECFEQRYNQAKNLYAKTEYGLMVYFGQKTRFSKGNDFKAKLCDELLSLAHIYYGEANAGDYQKIGYIFNTLKIVYGIASNSKLEKQIAGAIEFIFEIQQNWNIEDSNTKYVPLRYSGFMLENYKTFNKFIDFDKVITRNDYAISLIENDNPYNAADAIIVNDKIKKKVGQSLDESLQKRAKIYESIAEQRKNDMASLHFIGLALDLYKRINNEDKIKELEKLYNEKKGSFPLNEVKVEIPKLYIETVTKTVKEIVKSNDVKSLLDLFADSPWYEKDDSIRSLSEAVERGLIDMLQLKIIDDWGNTLKEYSPDKGKFWTTYGYYFGFGTMKMHELFFTALKSNKITYESTLSYLEKTWLNQPIERNSNGVRKSIIPLDTIKPGLNRIFNEFKKLEGDSNYLFDTMTIIDSLTIKIEGLLRFYLERIGISPFTSKKTKDGYITMAKLLDAIIAELEDTPEKATGFIEDDRTLIKYVMSEKIGWNLRNEVAHSLMQIEDYTTDKIVVLFCLILKLSKYTFGENELDVKSE